MDLDIDTTIKLLYGHQDGAEISYNPTKPGRPTHVIHTYWIANVRLVLTGRTRPSVFSYSRFAAFQFRFRPGLLSNQ